MNIEDIVIGQVYWHEPCSAIENHSVRLNKRTLIKVVEKSTHHVDVHFLSEHSTDIANFGSCTDPNDCFYVEPKFLTPL